MYFREIKFGTFRSQISNYFIFFFGVTFYTSWLYEISALGINSWDNFSHAKNIIVLCFMLLMSVSIKWKIIRFDIFLGCCIAWTALCIIFWVIYQEPAISYFRRIGQIIFVFLFITYLRQHPENNPCVGKKLARWFYPWVIFVFLLVLIVLNLTTQLSVDILNGFGNSRVNFSIWLVQIVALILFSKLFNSPPNTKTLLICLILITPAYVLQNMTGGRSGLLGSFVLVIFFAYRQGGYKALLISGIWLYLVTLIVATYHPLISDANNLDVFRNAGINASIFSQHGIVVWLDRMSSYRLSILITAFSNLNLQGFLFGIGLGNFVGWVPTYPQLGIVEVHNVFLKILGEFGIFGFLVFLLLVILPITYKPKDKIQSTAIYLQLTYFLIAMIHPDLLLTAVNLSFVYLSCLAISINFRDQERNMSTASD